mgnify:CR=1 FL=1
MERQPLRILFMGTPDFAVPALEALILGHGDEEVVEAIRDMVVRGAPAIVARVGRALSEAGIEPECTAAWEAQADAIHEAADEYGVLVASFYDEFNGTNHDEDPREKGYIAADGWHQSQDAGVAAQVEVLQDLGARALVGGGRAGQDSRGLQGLDDAP